MAGFFAIYGDRENGAHRFVAIYGDLENGTHRFVAIYGDLAHGAHRFLAICMFYGASGASGALGGRIGRVLRACVSGGSGGRFPSLARHPRKLCFYKGILPLRSIFGLWRLRGEIPLIS